MNIALISIPRLLHQAINLVLLKQPQRHRGCVPRNPLPVQKKPKSVCVNMFARGVRVEHFSHPCIKPYLRGAGDEVRLGHAEQIFVRTLRVSC